MEIKDKIILPLSGLNCASCANTIEKAINEVDGVRDVAVNFATLKASFFLDDFSLLEKVIKAVQDAGYNVVLTHKSYLVQGMSCASCVRKVEDALKKVQGVLEASVNLATNKATVEVIDTLFNEKEISNAVKKAGYSLVAEEQVTEDIGKLEYEKVKRTFFISFIFSIPFVILMVSMLLDFEVALVTNKYVQLFFASVVQFYCGMRFYKGAFLRLRHFSSDMNTLIALGTSTAYFYSLFVVLFPGFIASKGLSAHLYFESSALIITIILLGRTLEASAKGKSSEAIKKLMDLSPKKALVIIDGEEKLIDASLVNVGDIIIVKPGEKIPLDGVIIDGDTSVDESMITGESKYVDKKAGDKIIGATINKQGSFKMKATAIGKDSVLSAIVKLVEEAQASKPPIAHLVDKVASIFVPTVIVIAIVTFFIWLMVGGEDSFTIALVTFISVLIIACPCALGLATPVSIMVGLGKGASEGILVRSGEGLEVINKVNAIVMDKTGTITVGEPRVSDIKVFKSGLSEEDFLKSLATLENKSEHPLARAIVFEAKERGMEMDEASSFRAIEGKGLKGEIKGKNYFAGSLRLIKEEKILINEKDEEVIETLQKTGATIIVFADEKELLGVLSIKDKIKDTSKEAVAKLKKMKIKVFMLTGDNKEVATQIANEVGIDEVFSEVLPHDKVEKIKELKEKGYIVAMAGDGINDAPALTASDVGIAMGQGTDIAMEASDITIVKGDLLKIVNAISLSKATLRNIKQNLFFAFFYNTALIPVAAGVLYPLFGILLNPVFAAVAMGLSSVSVVTNALRLKKY